MDMKGTLLGNDGVVCSRDRRSPSYVQRLFNSQIIIYEHRVDVATKLGLIGPVVAQCKYRYVCYLSISPVSLTTCNCRPGSVLQRDKLEREYA